MTMNTIRPGNIVCFKTSRIDNQKKYDYFIGICISMSKKTCILRNTIKGISVEWSFDLSNPNLEIVKMIDSKNSYRRAKLYYLRSLPMKELTINSIGIKL